jgi:hypothetical protein
MMVSVDPNALKYALVVKLYQRVGIDPRFLKPGTQGSVLGFNQRQARIAIRNDGFERPRIGP